MVECVEHGPQHIALERQGGDDTFLILGGAGMLADIGERELDIVLRLLEAVADGDAHGLYAAVEAVAPRSAPAALVDYLDMFYGLKRAGGMLRKVDGAEILRRIERHGVTLLCGAPAVVAAVLDVAESWDGPIPGRDRVRMVVAGAPPPTRVIERMETELGWEFIQIYGLTETAPLLTVNRTRAELDDLSPADRAAKLGRAGVPGPSSVLYDTIGRRYAAGVLRVGIAVAALLLQQPHLDMGIHIVLVGLQRGQQHGLCFRITRLFQEK